MKLTIEGNTEEIKNVLQAIGGSKEHEENYVANGNGAWTFSPSDLIDALSLQAELRHSK